MANQNNVQRTARKPAPRPAVVEPMESRTMLSVVPGYSETQFAGGGKAVRWVSAMDFAPDGRLFIASQFDSRYNGGVLWVAKGGKVQSTPVLKLPVSRGFERGLVGVLADQNFNSNHHIYVYWTAQSTPKANYVHNVISRFTIVGDKADMSSRVDIFEQGGLGSDYHNGGSMHWGPDGKLYVGVGDNAFRANGQSLNTTKGKILRINKDGSIPSDNPFYTKTTGISRAIWSLGFRNPFTFAFSPSGRLFVNDVGNDQWEEVNEATKGSNHGWATIEGPRAGQTPPANYKDPIYAYKHNPAVHLSNAIAGAEFWNGKYVFGDYVTGNLKFLDPGSRAVSQLGKTETPVDIDVGPDGALYYLSSGLDAKVFRVSTTGSQAPGITSPPVDKQVAVGASATFSVTAFGSNLKYQWQRNGSNIAGATGASYTLGSAKQSDSGANFRVVVSNGFGSATSAAAKLTVVNDNAPVPVINTPAAGLTWTAGTTLNFSGSATDAEDGALRASALTWSVDYYTNTAKRPLFNETSGIKSGSVAIPAVTPYTRADVFLRVTLTATDSDGISTTIVRDVVPKKSTLTVKTNVPGLTFTLDETEYTATQSALAVVGVRRTLGAPLTQNFNGKTYEFTGWSDGGARQHAITTPAASTTYTANFKVVGDAPTPVGPAVTGISVINADTEKAIGTLASGGAINLNATPRINLRADVSGTVGSVVFKLNGAVVRTESYAPFAIADNDPGVYSPWNVAPGTYTLVATPYAQKNGQGAAGTSKTVTFTVTKSGTTPPPATGTGAVTSFSLINADTEGVVRKLTNGSTISRSALPRFTVRADVAGTVGSVVFRLNGKVVKTESYAPFAMSDNDVGSYENWAIGKGTYTLSARTFSAKDGLGTAGASLSVTFTVA